jgi:hypothetical protein
MAVAVLMSSVWIGAQTPSPGAYVPGSDRAIAEARAGVSPAAPEPAPPVRSIFAPLADALGLLGLVIAILAGILLILAILMPYFVYRIHEDAKAALVEVRAIRAAVSK